MLIPKFFQPRSAERDQANDEGRYRRIETFLDGILSEIDREQSGLQRRYQSQQLDASMAVGVEEATEPSQKLQSRLSALETGLIYCEQRLGTLSQHSDVIRRMRLMAREEADQMKKGDRAA